MKLVETLWQDSRYAFRALRKSPGFTAVAVLLLALGIGANTAVFSVVHAVLLRPLPFAHPDRLVRLIRGADRSDVSIPEFQFWKQHASSFESVTASDSGVADTSLDTGTSFEWIKVTRVSQDFLKTLGVAPALGREFNADETRSGGAQAILLTDSLWRRTFGANPDILGRTVTVGKTKYTVAGVLPRDFWFSRSPDALLPLQPSGTVGDTGANTTMLARLKDGVTLPQAAAEQAALTESFRDTKAIELSADYRGLTPVLYQDDLASNVRTNLLLLTGAVGLLLLIACSNLAGLILARAAGRSKEIAVRMALGSSTRRLLRQSLIENVFLGTAGGFAGWLLASSLVDGLVALSPFTLRTPWNISLDRDVLWFNYAVALGTSLIFSLAPLATSLRIDISEALKFGGRAPGGRAKARSVLVAGQVALTVTLLVSAALLIQTLYRLQSQELGFKPHSLITMWTPLSPARREDAAATRRFEATMLERLKALPGVSNVAAINVLPLAGVNNFPTQRDGHPEQSIGAMEIRRVSPEVFDTMGIRVLKGRRLLAADRDTSAPVMLVNETLARQWWAESSPLGDRVYIGRNRGKDLNSIRTVEPAREVVGVVADTRRRDMKEAPRATVYIPAEQSDWMGQDMNWVLRGTFPAGFAEQLRRAVAEVDPQQRVDRIKTMDEIVAGSTADSRFNAWLFGAFAGVALLLTAAGIYGLLAFSVARRSHEIGTRMALGSSRAGVVRLILGEGFVLIVIGLAAGLAGAVAVSRMLSSSKLLFNVRAADPVSYFAVAGVLLVVGFLASYVPARRAANVDPMVALRSE